MGHLILSDGRTFGDVPVALVPRLPVAPKIDAAAFAVAARRVVNFAITTRAAKYERRPQQLDAVFPGLGRSTRPDGELDGHRLFTIAEALLENERRMPRRFVGFGGETIEINLRAVRLLGWRLRRMQRAEQREAA